MVDSCNYFYNLINAIYYNAAPLEVNKGPEMIHDHFKVDVGIKEVFAPKPVMALSPVLQRAMFNGGVMSSFGGCMAPSNCNYDGSHDILFY